VRNGTACARSGRPVTALATRPSRPGRGNPLPADRTRERGGIDADELDTDDPWASPARHRD
jgi:hypothetical protein